MNKQEKINKLIEEALNSADHVKRASPMPFLQTRLNARLNKSKEDTWDKAGWYISRPSIAFAGLALLIIINGMAVLFNRANSSFTIATEQSAQDQADEFNYTVTALYDNENIEP